MGKVLEYIGKFLLVPLLKDLYYFFVEKYKEYQAIQKEKAIAEEKLKEATKRYNDLKKAETDEEILDAFDKLP